MQIWKIIYKICKIRKIITNNINNNNINNSNNNVM